jgi:3-phosphoshikimate 1-carboxyvinyltransferase
MEAFGATVQPTITGFDIDNDGYRPTDYVIEPDASAAAYPMVAAAITRGRVEISGLTRSSPQPDVAVAGELERMGCHISESESGLVVDATSNKLSPIQTDMAAAPDGALALAVACLFADGTSRIGGLHSLQYKESDRLRTMTQELRRLGADVGIEDDSMVIAGGALHRGQIDPHGDHRIAMSVALVGLAVDGVEVLRPDVVDKTWPEYWTMIESLIDSVSESK